MKHPRRPSLVLGLTAAADCADAYETAEDLLADVHRWLPEMRRLAEVEPPEYRASYRAVLADLEAMLEREGFGVPALARAA